MKKILLVTLLMSICIIFTGCADSKTFKKKDGTEFVAEPYGWANSYKKIEGVIYEPVLGDIVWSVVAIQTVIVPVWLTGWEIVQPVMYVEPENTSQKPKQE